jgi:hypothetical protein
VHFNGKDALDDTGRQLACRHSRPMSHDLDPHGVAREGVPGVCPAIGPRRDARLTREDPTTLPSAPRPNVDQNEYWNGEEASHVLLSDLVGADEPGPFLCRIQTALVPC